MAAQFNTPRGITTLCLLVVAIIVPNVTQAALFNTPKAIASDNSDNLYVADYNNQAVRKITPAAVVTTFAGLPGHGGGDPNGLYDGTGSSARFTQLTGIAVDQSSGNIYATDHCINTVRKITPAAVVTTLAGIRLGTSTAGVFLDHTNGIGVDQTGSVYFTTITNTLWKITSSAVLTTFADLGGPHFNYNGVAIDSSGNVYVCASDHSIRKVTSGGVVSVFSGTRNRSCDGSFDNYGNPCTLNGTTAAALYRNPQGIAIDSAGAIYIADSGNHIIRKISSGNVTTLAGSPSASGSTDDTGSAARFNAPLGVAVDSSGNVFVADTGNHTIRKITPSGVVTTFAGTAGVPGSSD